MRRTVSLVTSFVILVAACENAASPASPALPSGAVPMTPLPVYEEWWRMTQACSGTQDAMARVDWYVIPGVESFSFGLLENVAGMYESDRIVLAGTAVRDGRVVRHEMLHALLRSGRHPRSQFADDCSGVVNCVDQCRDEVEPPPVTLPAVAITPELLDVSVQVWPEQPGGSVLGGYIRLAVSARNRLNHAVEVQLSPSGSAGPVASFGYEAVCRGILWWYDDRAWAPEVMRFGPRETKVRYYDFWTSGGDEVRVLPTGEVEFRGRYGDNWSATRIVTVTP